MWTIVVTLNACAGCPMSSLLSLLSSLGGLIVGSHALAFLAGVALVLLEPRRAPSDEEVEQLVGFYRARYRGNALGALREHRFAVSLWAQRRERELLARVAAALEAAQEGPDE